MLFCVLLEDMLLMIKAIAKIEEYQNYKNYTFFKAKNYILYIEHLVCYILNILDNYTNHSCCRQFCS